MFNSAKSRAIKKGLEFSLISEDLIDLYHKQNGKCATSNLVMEFKQGPRHRANSFTISLDRIDSEKGYTKANIQFLCWQINRMKGPLTEDEFKFWLKIISSQAL